MIPDYSRQLERLIVVLSQKDPVPTWVISIVSAFLGSLATILLGVWKERRDARRRRRRIERAIYGEMLLNYSSLFGTLTTDLDFRRVGPTQKVLDGTLTCDALENARAQGDGLYYIPNFGVIRTLYKTYDMMSGVSGGGEDVRGLAHYSVSTFETLFASDKLDQALLLEMSATFAPGLKSRLLLLSESRIKPGEQLNA